MDQAVRAKIEAWNERLAQYARLGHDRLAALDAIVRVVSPLPGKVLDVGTGKGMLAEALAKAGTSVVSIDVDPAQIELARARMGVWADRVQFVLADASKMPFGQGEFPLVISVDAIHHMERFDEVGAEIARVLEPSGRVLLVDFTQEGFEILDKAFAERGQVHRTTGLTLDDAMGSMERLGFVLLGRMQAHQQDIALLQRKG